MPRQTVPLLDLAGYTPEPTGITFTTPAEIAQYSATNTDAACY
ncbi:hypothetical protein ABIA39_001085 [Nocardia sp. GAS34]